MIHDEGTVIDEVFTNGLPCEMKLPTYNDAISLQARLNRYIKAMREAYADRENNQFENLDVVLIRPKTLRFEYRGKLKITKSESPSLWEKPPE